MSHVWHLLSCWRMTGPAVHSANEWSLFWFSETSLQTVGLWVPVSVLHSESTCACWSLQKQTLFTNYLLVCSSWFPLTSPLQPLAAGPQRATWKQLPTPAPLSSCESLIFLPLRCIQSPSHCPLSSLFPTGVWPEPQIHSSLCYCHVSTLLGSRSYDIH